MSGQGGDLVFPEPIRHQATQEEIEQAQTVLSTCAVVLRDMGWPVRFFVQAPGSMIVQNAPFPAAPNDEYIYVLAIPMAGAPDVWRQHANRDKKEDV